MKRVERYHSSVWGAFLDNATLQLDKTRPVYRKNSESDRDRNKRRKLIAPAESESSCLVVVDCCVALECFANSMAYWQKVTSFSPWNDLPTKLQKIGLKDINKVECIRELTVCRDSVVHGHIWTKMRSSDVNYNLKQVRSYLWKPFRQSLKKKYIKNVDWENRITKIYKFSIIPIDISYVDGVKAFQILISVMEDIFEKMNMAWRPSLYPHKANGYSEDTFQALHEKTLPEEWMKYFVDQLSDKDIIVKL